MLSVDDKILPTIKEMIITICAQGGGYNNAWPELMTLFAQILVNKNPTISLTIYHLISKIIKRYRLEFKSHELFEEIKNTIREIAPVLTDDAALALNFLFSEQKNDIAFASLYMNMLKHILHIFYALNYQDFPEFFEDHLKTWMGILKGTLETQEINNLDINCLRLFLGVKSTVMKCLNLYCNNYYEDILAYHNDFFAPVWNLTLIVKHEDLYSKLIRELLDYYKILFQYTRQHGFDEKTIQHLVNNLIIPEMRMTNKEVDDFQDNPINFLKIELEEADMDSNKYHAIALLKNLLTHFPNLTEDHLKPMINNYLQSYYADQQKTVMNKIIAINLIFATYIKTFAQRSKYILIKQLIIF